MALFNLGNESNWFPTMGNTAACEPCNRERDTIVEMDRDYQWSPALAAEVAVFECPECGHTVMADGELHNFGDE